MKWIFSEGSSTVNFMDLTLTLVDGKIHSSLHEKDLNHHLYIAPHSAHPPGVTLGLIYGLAFRIVTLCSDESDILAKLQESFRHLVRRGYYAADDTTPTEWALVANLLTIWQFKQLTAVSTLISMASNLTLEASRTCQVEILFKKCCEHPKALKMKKPANCREM
jgi:hypothetical protein